MGQFGAKTAPADKEFNRLCKVVRHLLEAGLARGVSELVPKAQPG